jgi:HSP20 family protein
MRVKGKGDFERLQTEIQDLIDELWQVPRFSGLRRGFRPQVDVYLTDEPRELTVVVELPGVEAEHVQLFADEQTLVVVGERCRPRLSGRYQQMEIEYGAFQRRIPLGVTVDPASARAEYSRGLLTVVLPTVEAATQTKKVSIPVGGRV